MASKAHKIEGIIHWAKVTEDTRDLDGYQGQAREWDGEYSIDLVVSDPEERAKFKETGSMKKFKTDPDKYDGQPWLSLTRKHNAKGKDGETVVAWSGPPLLYDVDGNAWDEEILIGNGTQAVAKVIVYDVPKGKGTRLDAIQVVELVEYEPEDKPRVADEVPF